MLTQIIDPEFIYGAKTQEIVISFYHLDVIPGFYALTKEDLVLKFNLTLLSYLKPIFNLSVAL